jgi:hypothetical protein
MELKAKRTTTRSLSFKSKLSFITFCIANYFGIVIFVFYLLFIIACNNQQNKKPENTKINNSEKLEPKELKPCKYMVTLILITSPRYKELTRGLNKAVKNNGGLYFGVRLEGSPNPQSDKASKYSETYDFVVFEMYADRELNTARFVFNPDNEKLYEYDAVEDQLKRISFDLKLLPEYESCFNRSLIN